MISATLLRCRKLGTLALEAVQRLVDASAAGGPVATAGNATESSGDGAALLDLTGDREFLTRETAEDALAAMLAKDAALRKVLLPACPELRLAPPQLQLIMSTQSVFPMHAGRAQAVTRFAVDCSKRGVVTKL